MRQVVVTRHGPPEVLQVHDAPDPIPGPGEVRIAVRAAGVNFSDILARVGLYPGAPKPPCVVGYEVAGVIDAAGPGTSRRRVGDRVMAFTDFGGYADSVVVPEALTCPAAARRRVVEAAAVPVTYLAAVVALYRLANLSAGETVLIHGAAGGVGTAAVQLARLRQATVIGTASPHKHEAVRALGADHMIDYRDGGVAARVRALTNNRGVDVVLDPLGGRSLGDSYRLLAPLGRLIFFGASDAIPGTRRRLWRVARTFLQMPTFRPLSLLHDNRSVHGLHVGRLFGEVPRLTPLMELICREIDAGRLQPVVDRTFPLERAADAHHFMHARANIGKIVLSLSGATPPRRARATRNARIVRAFSCAECASVSSVSWGASGSS